MAQTDLGEFGFDLAMNDRHLIVGDPNSAAWCGGASGCARGAAYAYTFNSDTDQWDFLDFIFPDDVATTGGFGPGVDLHEDRAVIGSFGVESLGGAYVFEFAGGAWVQRVRLLPPIGSLRGPWGQHVAIWGDRAVVGNAGEDVLFFVNGGEGWELVADMSSPDMPVGRSDFGDALDIDDQWLVIGAFGEKIFGPEHGAVYLYRLEGDGEPILTQKLLPPRPTEAHRFGKSVSISGNCLVVGATLSDRGTSTTSPEGGAFVYQLQNSRWELVQELEAVDPKPAAYFGSSVAVNGDVIAVGSRRDLSDTSMGAAHLFRRATNGQWDHTAYVAPSLPGAVPFNIGESIALANGRMVVGGSDSFYNGDDRGSAHAYNISCLICEVDLDADGTLTIFDFLTFLNLFQDGDPIADFDGDGELTIFDFLAFQTAFDAGCE